MCVGALGAQPPPAQAAGISPPRSALLVFIPAGESRLAGVSGLSVGIMSAGQGRYSQAQLALDISQGARVATSAYTHPTPPPTTLLQLGSSGLIEGWRAARRRAEEAPQLLRPGLLAGEIPGEAGYAGISESAGTAYRDSLVAADRSGHIAAVSLGSVGTLTSRVEELARRKLLVVADLPGGGEGEADLHALSAARAPGELLIVVQRPGARHGGELLWTAIAGLAGGGGRGLSSQSTNERGLIASFDVAPTILQHLGLRVPADVRGRSIVNDGPLHSASLRSLMARLRVIAGRRLKALGFLLVAWLLLVALAATRPRGRAWAMRSGALGVLWAPVATLITAALEPSAAVECATIAVLCMGLGALTDTLVPWPRAALAPAIVTLIAIVVDALAGTQLLMRSLLGPDPALGDRFYGIGNELKSGLAVLVLAAVAGALYPAVRGARAAVVVAIAGGVLAVVEGSARIGAGVGGVILVCFGFAVSTLMLAPGALTRRRALIVLISPVVGLVALAAIDLATAHGGGHFTGSVLDARSPSDVRDIIVRRYGAAWDELRDEAMPVATALALIAAALGVRRRALLLSPVVSDPGWLAAFAGGLAAGVVGTLVEDSGPVLLVVAVFTLGCVGCYLWGGPRPTTHRQHQGMARPGELARAPGRYSSSPGIGSIGSSS
ncbi:MAG TPA: hypothetical protein VIH92_04775 [Solirubrobacteraceae bacterium]